MRLEYDYSGLICIWSMVLLLRKFFLAFVAIFLIYSSFADTTVDNIRNKLKVSLPELKVDRVTPSVVPNIYQVFSGHKVFYVDSSGNYAFLGNLVDLNTKKSLTEATVQELSVVNIDDLPLTIAIRRVIGNGDNRLVVFTDPDCPFCQRLEQDTISKLNNITVYYFLYPLPIHKNAISDSKKILCAENPDATFVEYMNKGIQLPKRVDCNSSKKLDTMINVANKYGVDATPTIVLPNGKLISGLVPVDYLNKLIQESTVVTKQKLVESTSKGAQK